MLPLGAVGRWMEVFEEKLPFLPLPHLPQLSAHAEGRLGLWGNGGGNGRFVISEGVALLTENKKALRITVLFVFRQLSIYEWRGWCFTSISSSIANDFALRLANRKLHPSTHE